MMIPSYPLHPASIAYLKKGHPWVTKDRFSAKFDPSKDFVVGTGKRDDERFLLLNDSTHSQVVARLWRVSAGEEQYFKFTDELVMRLENAISKREEWNCRKKRDNFYLLFGEADFIPGLFIQKLGPVILFQSYSTFWNKYQSFVTDFFIKKYPEHFLYWQNRTKDQQIKMQNINGAPSEIAIQEFGIKYQLRFGQHYDFGIYTDMSAIRDVISYALSESKKMANLYCYTGAYSLFALRNGCSEVHSVDLSGKYLDWLDENLNLNPALLEGKTHIRHEKSVDDFLKNCDTFDLILTDPPSASSDGQRVNKAFDQYPMQLWAMYKKPAPGGRIIAFLNTHTVSRVKFITMIKKTISQQQMGLKIELELSLKEDCPRLRGFTEGDYLKGVILKKKGKF